MKRLYLAILLAGFALAQKSDKEKPSPLEVKWACQLGSSHQCNCPAMVAEAHEAHIKDCIAHHSGSDAEYSKCMNSLPPACDVVAKPDSAHPEHTCRRTCTHAVCRCHDGPMCVGPSLTEYNDENNY